MELTTARQLADLNRRFYDDHALAFASVRSGPQPGVKRILATIPAGAVVLEIGCGDGKVARALAAHSKIASYLGLDLSPAMLDRARAVPLSSTPAAGSANACLAFSSRHSPFAFALADLTSPDWSQVLASRAFDWILAFAVFHHLPGSAARAQTLRTLAEHLAPGGTCVMSNWQFTRSQRLQQHILPWSALDLTQAKVEPGDYLLSWERGGQRGLRYVHLLDETEARQMAAAAGLSLKEVFRSDGATGDLADYVVMRKSG